MKTLYLHCGTHKTGSTAIQMFLHDNKKILSKNNIEYPEIGYTTQYAYNNHNIFWNINGDHRYELSSKGYNDFINYLKKEKKNIIISSEDIQFINIKKDIYKDLLENLKKCGYELKVIIYLRNQIDYLKGIYQSMLMSGASYKNINEAVDELKTNSNYIKWKEISYCFDYHYLINNIIEMLELEKKNLICLSYDENKNFLLDNFLKIININEKFDFEKYQKINRGIYQLSVNLIEKFNNISNKIDVSDNQISKAKHALIYGLPFHIGKKFEITDKLIREFLIKSFKEKNEVVEKLFNIKINKWLN
tara:strand:- start:547 stop:1461 length:915 start_codon:yes stop_codon:yes gene_type:complete